LSTEDLEKLNKNKKLVKNLAARYEAFVASQALIKQFPRLLGRFRTTEISVTHMYQRGSWARAVERKRPDAGDVCGVADRDETVLGHLTDGQVDARRRCPCCSLRP
jgi:hypothetical protein